MARESKIEQYLIAQWNKRTKGEAIKFVPLFFAGFPDRICLAKPAIIVFVELKKEGKQPRKLQEKVHRWLRGMLFRVEVIDTEADVDAFIDSVRI